MMGRPLRRGDGVGFSTALRDRRLPWARSRSPSPARARYVLDEVAQCAGEMEALQEKMSWLHERLRDSPEDDDDEEGEDGDVLEAHRNLAEYLGLPASAPRGREPQAILSDYLPVDTNAAEPFAMERGWRRSRSCPGSPSARVSRAVSRNSGQHQNLQLLLPQIAELGDLIEQRQAEIADLWGELQSMPGEPAELTAVARENESLSAKTQQNSATVASLRAESASLAWEIDHDRQRIHQIQLERCRLLRQIGSFESGEAYAEENCTSVEAELEEHRRRAHEQILNHESSLAALGAQADCAEKKLSEEMDACSRTQVEEAQEQATVALESRAALLQSEHHQRQASELEDQLKEKQLHLQNVMGSRSAEAEVASLANDLRRAQAEVTQGRASEQALQLKLAASRRRSDETEQKALSVARELVDSSQAIAWLRAEVAKKADIKAEIQAVQSRNAALKQQIQELSATPRNSARTPEPMAQARALAPTNDNRTAKKSPEMQLRQLQAGQTAAVNEALREAWDGEARAHRSTQKRIEALRSRTLPVQQQLRKLVGVARHLQEDLLQQASITFAPSSSSQSPGLPNGNAAPPLPDEAAFSGEEIAPDAARALCQCFEYLAASMCERLKAREVTQALPCTGDQLAPMATLQNDPEQLALCSERLALQQELDFITQQPIQEDPGLAQEDCPSELGPPPHTSAGTTPDIALTAPSLGSTGGRFAPPPRSAPQSPSLTVSSAVSPCGTPGRMVVQQLQQQQQLQQIQQQQIQQQQLPQQPPPSSGSAWAPPSSNAWPPSPIFHGRSCLRNRAMPSGKCSVTSSLSSVSLQDNNRSMELQFKEPVSCEPSHMQEPEAVRLSQGGMMPEAEGNPGSMHRISRLQRHVADLERRILRPQKERGHSAGPLYRMASSRAAPASEPIARATGAWNRAASSGTGHAVRSSNETRRIPVRRGIGTAVGGKPSADRFDADSVHNPRRFGGLL